MAARSWYTCVFITILVLCNACAQTRHEGSQTATPTATVVRFESSDLRVTLEAVIGIEQERSLVRNPEWLEYVLSIENPGHTDLTVQNVKLLNDDGRYVDSASSYQQITVAPDVSSQVAGTVGRHSRRNSCRKCYPLWGFHRQRDIQRCCGVCR